MSESKKKIMNNNNNNDVESVTEVESYSDEENNHGPIFSFNKDCIIENYDVFSCPKNWIRPPVLVSLDKSIKPPLTSSRLKVRLTKSNGYV